MKRIAYILFLLLNCLALRLYAQVDSLIKPSTLAFHVSYIDFNTTRQIQATSLGNVISNNLWSNIGNMQMGFGVNYLRGLSHKIDLAASLDGSPTDYLFKDGTYNGSNQLLLEGGVGVNAKLFTDNHTVVPYLSAGAGFSVYNGKSGVYIPVGAGLQFNVFNQAFVFTNMQYKRGLSPAVTNYIQYSIGIASSIAKKKIIKPKTEQPVKILVPDTEPAIVKIIKPDTIPVIVKIPVKNVVITITDEQTGLSLPLVEVSMVSPNVKLGAFTDGAGKVTFTDVTASNYTVSGVLNGVSTTNKQLSKSDFDIPAQEINISLTHNDPRFTLAGTVTNKSTRNPEGGVIVTADNLSQNSSISVQNNSNDGTFNLQLAPGSDFSISGKKAGYISNIEQLTTKGLTRSTTLYVKLELGIEQALPNKTITLSNIYYDTGSIKIRASASSDLEKLVRFLKDNPELKIEIDSHTDSRGNAANNLKLSQARAQEVVNYLQKNDIDKARLIPKGYGATKLVNGCKVGVKCTDAQHEQNRRTEFKVVDK